MNFKKLIIVLTIAFSVIFAVMIGTSYAYYFASGGTVLNVTTGSINTGVAVVFKQSQYINVSTGIPISSSDVDTLAENSVFTLTPDTSILNDADVAINISIIDILIDNALRVEEFKYKFVCNDGTTSTVLSSGDGTNFTDDIISRGTLALGTLSTSDNTFDVDNTYTCTFSVWLEENNEDQNELMNKKFRGLIKVNTVFKK